MREGYLIETYFRFPAALPARRLVLAKDAGREPVVEVEYIPQAEIWRINNGWRRSAQPDGFAIDANTGVWQRQTDDEDDEPNGTKVRALRRQVTPYVSDTRNVLLLRIPSEQPDEDFLTTLSYSLRRAIQIEYQIEEQEIAIERIGRDRQRQILLWEAAEGGIGVWERLIEEPAAFPKLARTALDLLHFDAATGDDLADGPDRCPAACYDCLLSYANQLDHRHLNRHLVRDFLLRLASSVPVVPPGRSYDEQYAWLRERTDPASSFEQTFLDHLYNHKLRLPDFAQYTPTADVYVQPDFYYQRGVGPGICIFIDGPQHADATRAAEDRRGRDALEDRGYRIIAITTDASLANQICRYPEVFCPV